MKKLLSIAIMAVSAIATFGAEPIAAEENILSNRWGLYGKAETRGTQSFSKGIFTIENKAGQHGGFYQSFLIKKPATTITISGESRAENVVGNPNANYCLYADIRFVEGKPMFGKRISFKTGTHDWEKAELVIPTQRKIKSMSFYILFRNMTGKVQFRNIKVTAK